jgi:hypothetical protein
MRLVHRSKVMNDFPRQVNPRYRPLPPFYEQDGTLGDIITPGEPIPFVSDALLGTWGYGSWDDFWANYAQQDSPQQEQAYLDSLKGIDELTTIGRDAAQNVTYGAPASTGGAKPAATNALAKTPAASGLGSLTQTQTLMLFGGVALVLVLVSKK